MGGISCDTRARAAAALKRKPTSFSLPFTVTVEPSSPCRKRKSAIRGCSCQKMGALAAGDLADILGQARLCLQLYTWASLAASDPAAQRINPSIKSIYVRHLAPNSRCDPRNEAIRSPVVEARCSPAACTRAQEAREASGLLTGPRDALARARPRTCMPLQANRFLCHPRPDAWRPASFAMGPPFACAAVPTSPFGSLAPALFPSGCRPRTTV